MTRLWGRSSKDLYLSGDSGNVCQFNGNSWRLIQTGVSARLSGLSGTQTEVWACGLSQGYFESALVTIEDNGAVQTLWQRRYGQGNSPPYGFALSSLWIKPGSQRVYLASANAVYHATKMTVLQPVKMTDLSSFPYMITGTDHNNILVAGDLGRIWQYNGKRWTLILEIPSTVFHAIAAKDDLVIAAGTNYSVTPQRAYLVIGRRI